MSVMLKILALLKYKKTKMIWNWSVDGSTDLFIKSYISHNMSPETLLITHHKPVLGCILFHGFLSWRNVLILTWNLEHRWPAKFHFPWKHIILIPPSESSSVKTVSLTKNNSHRAKMWCINFHAWTRVNYFFTFWCAVCGEGLVFVYIREHSAWLM